jgi:sugar phosphate isomerase/epimerase
MRIGLCSVTFRTLPPADVLATADAAGVEAIEWGADVHVPDVAAAGRVAQLTAEHGIATASVGSYYALGVDDPAEFADVLARAAALGAPRIRVWAGRTGSAEASDGLRALIAADGRRVGDLAAAAGVRVGVEFHGGTLTDNAHSTLDLLTEIDHPGVGTYWQPPVGMPAADALDGLRLVLDHVEALHVFSWWPAQERLPLAARADLWAEVAAVVAGRDLDALLEFVPDDDPAVLQREVGSLRAIAGRA